MAVSFIIPQPYNESLNNISLLTGTTGILKKTGQYTWELDDSSSSIPDQLGNAGKVLGTDGTNLSWVEVMSGGGFISYDQEQDLQLSQINQFRSNILEGYNPSITYDLSDRISTITYGDGSVKSFTYSLGGDLIRIDHVYTSPIRTVRKDFVYSDSKLASITETML